MTTTNNDDIASEPCMLIEPLPTPADPDAAPAAAATALVERIESHLHPTPSWDVADHPMPTRHEEIWRFTPLATFEPLLADVSAPGTLTWDFTAPDGISPEELTVERARELGAKMPSDRLAALAYTKSPNPGLLLQIPSQHEFAEPVVIDLAGRGMEQAVAYFALVEVGHHAKATLVVRCTGSALVQEAWTFRVGDGADLRVVVIQDWADDTVQGGEMNIVVGRDAHVTVVHATMGGKAVRFHQTCGYAGPGGSIDQYGVYFVDAGQHIEHRLFVDHNQPHTSSNVDYRGALQGKGAHSVWVGDVLIRKVAEGIETYEANKNLVLTDGCKADSIPNLEIETGQILGAGHSSTTGRFDDEQMFYLMARGIPEAEAKRLVVHGFFVDIVRRIGIPEIEAKLIAEIDDELAASIGSVADSELLDEAVLAPSEDAR